MDTETDGEEEDDPTSSSLIVNNDNNNDNNSDNNNDELKDNNDDELNMIISDDILFLCFKWLFPSELAKCMTVNKHWNEASKDNHIWQLLCSFSFKRISKKNLMNKYSNCYYEYYQRHNKLRFDGCYVMKVLYYIQSESAMPNFDLNVSRKRKPYTTIEYYRYLRFFNNQCDFIINNKTHKIEKIKNDESFDGIYALSKKKPSEYKLFDCFNSIDISHKNIKNNNKKIIASFNDKIDGITTNEKVFKAKYDICNKKQVSISIITDYGLKLELDLNYYEVIKGASDRLSITKFDGISLDSNENEIESMRDHYEIRHEPFIFIPDCQFKFAHQYFD